MLRVEHFEYIAAAQQRQIWILARDYTIVGGAELLADKPNIFWNFASSYESTQVLDLGITVRRIAGQCVSLDQPQQTRRRVGP